MARCWFTPITPEKLNTLSTADMASHLGLEYTRVADERLEAQIPVDERTRQPYGLLHGGVSCVVSESMGSTAANLCVDPEQYFCVGTEINASHLRGARAGLVRAYCEPIRIGRRIQVWQSDLFDEQQRHLCVSRLTVAVIQR